jgi:phosphonate transport system substrate-binding protein
MRRVTRGTAAFAALLSLALTACGHSPGDNRAQAAGDQTLSISAIPDQDPQLLQREFDGISQYLTTKLGVKVRYVPVTDYTASVTGFRRGDLSLVFFGGLTGVQARLQVPGAMPIAQRDIDAQFRSVFIASVASRIQPFHEVAGLKAFAGHSFTFGSESSTSGRLMPQYYLGEAGVKLDALKGQAGFSGSHDATIKVVEAGTYETGALNAAVWDARIKAGKVDTTKVKEVFRTPPFHDYHWLIRPDVDQKFGTGFTEKVKAALLALDGSDAQQRKILDLFQCKRFIAAKPDDYQQIEAVGRAAGLIK